MTNHIPLGRVLASLQQTMHGAGYWSDIAMSAEALSNQQPFCIDTMNFNQWLQYVFIPRMQSLIDAEQALPSFVKGQGLEPMASEFYKQTQADKAIIVLIRQVDELMHMKQFN